MLKRNTKIALIAICGLLAFVMLWIFMAHAVAKRGFAAAKKDLEAKGARLKVAQLYPPPAAGESNGAKQLLDALELLPEFD